MQLFSLHKNPRLLLTTVTALLQGVLLMWLHNSVMGERWPATSGSWIVALYAVGLFVPLTIQLMSEHWRSMQLWWVVGTMSVLFFYFGWNYGAHTTVTDKHTIMAWEGGFPFYCVVTLMWLHFLPFLRMRLATGRWRGTYDNLFAGAWQQAIMLAEAGLFTGLFWALLWLWAKLFDMLGYDFFEWLFAEPEFAYPFTATVLGVALYLTGSLERLVTVVREQLLGLLKWLALVAGLILALFAPTLLFKLPDLVYHGERAISAAWLLWLLAFTVLLLNAGYQNGRIEHPYPKVLGLFLRIVIPTTVIVAAVACYSLLIRVSEYGITVARVFAIIVALTGMVYAIGYTLAAVRRGPWLRGIERINVGVAVAIIAILALTLTPIASPYRLSASSQYSRALANRGVERESALVYLRFDAGSYGQRALQQLAQLPGETADIKDIRHQAQKLLDRESRWSPAQDIDTDAALANISVYPADRKLAPELLDTIRRDYSANPPTRYGSMEGSEKTQALFVDLNADGVEECVLITYPTFSLYARTEGGWRSVNGKDPIYVGIGETAVQEALAAGDYAPVPARWQDLRIGGHRVRLQPERTLDELQNEVRVERVIEP